MAISDAVKAKLNKMCLSAKDAELGTVIQNLQGLAVKADKHTVTAAQQTAGEAVINTGITINGFIVQVYRSSILLGSYKVSAFTTNLKVETNGANYVVTTGDVINYIVY